MGKIIYLYLKECPLGLKYLGITTQNPYTYRGSGKYWVNHLRANKITSKDLKTDILLESSDRDIIKFWSIYYSKFYNIVQSLEFANLINEEGEFSGISATKSKESREKQANKIRGISRPKHVRLAISKGHLNKIVSDITKDKLRTINLGKKQSLKTRIKKSKYPVLQIDKNTNKVIAEFPTLGYAQEITGFLKGNIVSAISGRLKTYKGFIWKYKINKEE